VPWRMTVLPIYAIAMIASGAAAGILGLISVIWGKERSSLVLLPIAFMLLVIVMLLGELFIPH
jgi:membrane associated rhomboid family serine protease